MSRTVYGNVKNADGTIPAGNMQFDLQELIVTDDGIVLPGPYEADLNNSTGDFTITLPTPSSGSALYHYTYPDGLAYATQLETGPSIDIATIQITQEDDVAQDALLALVNAAARLAPTNVSTAYQVLTADEYLRCSGAISVTLLALTESVPTLVVKNVGTGLVTLLPTGSDTIEGAASYVLQPGERIVLTYGAAGRWDTL